MRTLHLVPFLRDPSGSFIGMERTRLQWPGSCCCCQEQLNDDARKDYEEALAEKEAFRLQRELVARQIAIIRALPEAIPDKKDTDA